MHPRERATASQASPKQYEFRKTGEVFDDVVEALQSDRVVEMPTGIRELDSITHGVHRGHLAVVAARPGGGKTSIGCQIAWNIAKSGKTVFYYSLEMSKAEIISRIICNEVEVPHDLFYGSNEVSLADLTKIKSAQELFYKSKMAIFDDIGYKFNDVYTMLNDFKEKPDVIFVDHVQLVDKRGHGSPVEAIENYVRQAKETARKTNTAWVLLSQMNRDATQRTGSPRLENLKGSGSLEEIADFVLVGHWDGYNGAEYQMEVAKHRHGKRGQFMVNFMPQFYKFKNAGYSVVRPIQQQEPRRRTFQAVI